MLVFLILVLAAAIAIGFLSGRWAVVAVLAAAWPLYFLGLHQEWWGDGVGDGWQAAVFRLRPNGTEENRSSSRTRLALLSRGSVDTNNGSAGSMMPPRPLGTTSSARRRPRNRRRGRCALSRSLATSETGGEGRTGPRERDERPRPWGSSA
jgi:hypothetical protein